MAEVTMSREEEHLRATLITPYEHDTERDLARPTWQRGIGAILLSELAEQVFTSPAEEVPHDIVTRAGILAPKRRGVEQRYYKSHYVLDQLVWYRSYGLDLDSIEERLHPTTRSDLHKYTNYGREVGLSHVLYDGLRAQVHIPLNVVQLVAAEAANRSTPGYETTSVETIGQALGREDMRSAIRALAFTRNGVIRGLAGDSAIRLYGSPQLPRSDMARFLMQSVRFEPGGIFHMDARFGRFLRDALQAVNRMGDGTWSVETSPSSGCPAGHLAPHVDRDRHEEELARLSDIFEKPIESLLAPRAHTMIETGLDYMADQLKIFGRQTHRMRLHR